MTSARHLALTSGSPAMTAAVRMAAASWGRLHFRLHAVGRQRCRNGKTDRRGLASERNSDQVHAAFEVEHSTSIYSGIVRMLDLALGTTVGAGSTLFLVAPDSRRDDVQQQLRRPAFSRVSELGIRYLPYSQLQQHREAMARFGSGLKADAGDFSALALNRFGRWRALKKTLDLAIVGSFKVNPSIQ